MKHIFFISHIFSFCSHHNNITSHHKKEQKQNHNIRDMDNQQYHHQQQHNTTQQIVGIALVVEEIGKGSKLVFKYPLVPPSSSSSSSSSSSGTGEINNDHDVHSKSLHNSQFQQNQSQENTTTSKHNIFFRLESRILAKLFRTKPPLCGQPVSLNIEGTVFCCRSVLLPSSSSSSISSIAANNNSKSSNNHNQDDNVSISSSNNKQYNNTLGLSPSSSTNLYNHNHDSLTETSSSITATKTLSSPTTINGLVLFSIIVAMKPIYHLHENMNFKTYNDFHDNNNNMNDYNNDDKKSKLNNNHNHNQTKYKKNHSYTSYSRVNEHGSIHFEAVRKIHITLSRLCKVLEREEKRCLYVSRQVSHLLNVCNSGGDDSIDGGIGGGNSNDASISGDGTNNTNDKVDALGRDDVGNSSNNSMNDIIKKNLEDDPRIDDNNHNNNDDDDSDDDILGVSILDTGGGEDNNSIGSSPRSTTTTGTFVTITASNMTNVITTTNSHQNENGNGNIVMQTSPSGTSSDNNYSINTTQHSNVNTRKIFSVSTMGNNNDDDDRTDNPIANAMNNLQISSANGIKSSSRSRRGNNHSSSVIGHNEKLSHEEEEQRHKLDLMLAASPPPVAIINNANEGNDEEDIIHAYKQSIPLYGNLALELAQTYHALSRSFDDMRPSPETLLSGRDGIVYINLHVAVKVEAARAISSNNIPPQLNIVPSKQPQQNQPYLRSYHTLLFHPVSARELLSHKRYKHSNWRRLEKLLVVADDPFKSLSDMAVEAALTLPTVLDIATSLIEAGVCIALPVMTTFTRFGCSKDAVELMTSQRLDFAQQFGDIPIFMVVSALTTTINLTTNNKKNSTETNYDRDTKTLVSIGEVIEYSKLMIKSLQSGTAESGDRSDDDAFGKIPQIIQLLTHRILNTFRSARMPPGLADIKVSKANHSQLIENVLISMASWLRARSIILELKEYLTSTIDLTETDSQTVDSTTNEGEERSSLFWDNESLFKDFISQKHQCSGRISTLALAWKYGVNLRFIEAFRDWGVKEKKISSVVRMSTVNDDWGAP